MLGNKDGDFLSNSVVVKSSNKCIVVHGTDNVLVDHNVCYDHVGHGFALEDGCEEGNNFFHNLGAITRQPRGRGDSTVETELTALSTFWITNPNNRFRGNVAAGSDNAGFWFMLPSTPVGACAKTKPGLHPDQQALGLFDDNVAHSNKVGIAIEGGICNSPRSPRCDGMWQPPNVPQMRNLAVFKNSKQPRALWVVMSRELYFKDCKLADNGGSTLLSGRQIVFDSLFVGQSANILPHRLTGRKAVVIGHDVYDGPSGVVDSHFAGYSGPSFFAITRAKASIKAWNSFVSGLTFERVPPANRFVSGKNHNSKSTTFPQGLVDVTGSVTGRPQTTVMFGLDPDGGRRMDKDFNVRNSRCQFSRTLKAYVCKGVEWGTVMLTHGFSSPHNYVQVTRSDGRSAAIDSNTRPFYIFNAIIKDGLSYSVAYTNRSSLTWDGNTPRRFMLSLTNVKYGSKLTLKLQNLPTGNWQWRASECGSHKGLAGPTSGSSLTVTLDSKSGGRRDGKYPNQRNGIARAVVCAEGGCSC